MLAAIAGTLASALVAAQDLPRNLPLGVPVEAAPADPKTAQSVQQARRSLAAAPAIRAYGARLGRVEEAQKDAPRPRGEREIKLFETVAPAVVLVIAMDAGGEQSGMGSGSVLTRDGEILTNWHVIQRAQRIGVVFKPADDAQAPREPEVLPARLVKSDRLRDLALIKLARAPRELRTVTLGSLSGVKIGADVHAIGHPFGEAWTYTRGVVSQIRRPAQWSIGEERTQHQALAVIQTQTPINPGNSGGPLLGDDMKMLGVNTYSRRDAQGVNYAVSVDDVKRFLEEPAAKPAPKAQTKEAAKGAAVPAIRAGCEPRAGRRQRDEADRSWVTPVDTDCDGRADAVLIEWDNRPGRMLALDTNGDGRHDVVYVDEQGRGRWDYSLHDTDFDGKPDVRAHYDGVSPEPIRIVRVK